MSLQTITAQCSTLDAIKKLNVSFLWHEKSRRKEHDTCCHWREYIKKKKQEKVKQCLYIYILKKQAGEIQIKKRKLV